MMLEFIHPKAAEAQIGFFVFFPQCCQALESRLQLIPAWKSQLFCVPLQDFCSAQVPFPSANASSSWLANPSGPFSLLPNSSILAWAPNATYVPSWPPLSALRLLVSLEDQSCVEACQGAGLICEPALFRFVNLREAFTA